MTSPAIPFAKGHGTGNDFVILTDLDGRLGLTPAQVQRLCDRRHGIGGDGVLVITGAAAAPEVRAQDAEYFMDYRNADGSIAEMCGNGSRVFVRFLLEEGLVEPGPIPIATRGGTRLARTGPDGSICVEMGSAALLQIPELTVETVPEEGPKHSATGVLMPNPHAVCWVDDVTEAGELRLPPRVSPADAFPDGVNVEFVTELAAGHVAMRVYERGVGETQSCGTGACAAAVATLARHGAGPAGQQVQVDVPGGTLQVVWRLDGRVELSGPAVIVARGVIDDDWWSDQ